MHMHVDIMKRDILIGLPMGKPGYITYLLWTISDTNAISILSLEMENTLYLAHSSDRYTCG